MYWCKTTKFGRGKLDTLSIANTLLFLYTLLNFFQVSLGLSRRQHVISEIIYYYAVYISLWHSMSLTVLKRQRYELCSSSTQCSKQHNDISEMTNYTLFYHLRHGYTQWRLCLQRFCYNDYLMDEICIATRYLVEAARWLNSWCKSLCSLNNRETGFEGLLDLWK